MPLKGKLPVYQSSAYSVTVSTQEIGATYYPAGRDDQAIQGVTHAHTSAFDVGLLA